MQASDSLMSVGARILGVVVNDVPRGRSGYGYYNYGNYRYGYGYGNGSHKPGPKAIEGPTNGARLAASTSSGPAVVD